MAKYLSLNQLNEGLNDALETYFPKRSTLPRAAYHAVSALIYAGIKVRRAVFSGEVQVNERIVEYPAVLRWIAPQGTVLDIGSVSSRLPLQLASLGYDVHCVDTRAYGFQHPRLEVHQSDLFEWMPPMTFDSVLLVSVIEHFGLGVYGDLKFPEADREAVQRITPWIKDGGQLLVTVPFGKAGIIAKHRIYDMARLKSLFADFEWVDQLYCRRVDGDWAPCPAEELAQVESPDLPPNGVAMLHLRKAGPPPHR